MHVLARGLRARVPIRSRSTSRSIPAAASSVPQVCRRRCGRTRPRRSGPVRAEDPAHARLGQRPPRSARAAPGSTAQYRSQRGALQEGRTRVRRRTERRSRARTTTSIDNPYSPRPRAPFRSHDTPPRRPDHVTVNIRGRCPPLGRGDDTPRRRLSPRSPAPVRRSRPLPEAVPWRSPPYRVPASTLYTEGLLSTGRLLRVTLSW